MRKILEIYNTLSKKIEEVEPLEGDLIRIYSCGPTVYDYAHIGNLRKYVFDDLLVRTLKNFGYQVKRVMNITDVGHLTSDSDTGEDKIEKGARREGKTAWEIAKFYEKAFFEDIEKLNIIEPDIVARASEHIDDQINLIKKLDEKGFAYKIDDGIYFDTSKLADYGKLAHLNTEGQIEGARVEANQQKRNPTDFALWKFSYPSGRKFDSSRDDAKARRQMEWNSPWGLGFPGWHLECSAMSVKYLGQPFEIHTGGVDHISVHHTNEIAQSEAAEDKSLAKYWVHSEFVLENGHKMAKSEGHFIRLSDLEAKSFDPLDFRYLCLGAHYRSKLDFSYDSLAGAQSARQKIVNFARKIATDKQSSEEEKAFFVDKENAFEQALANDLDTPRALAIIFETISSAYESAYFGKSAEEFLEKIDGYLGLNLMAKMFFYDSVRSTAELPEEIIKLAQKRNHLRQVGDFAQADQLKQEIIAKGYRLEDSLDYVTIDKSAILK